MEVTSSNAPLAAALRQMAESGRIPHAMLFHENDGGGAFPLILDFLDAVYGHNPRVKKLIHPDIHFIFPVAGPAKDKPVSEQFIRPWRELLLANPCFYENELYAAIGIEYGEDFDKARQLVLDILKADARVKEDPAPVVWLKELGSSSVDMVIRCWTDNDNYWDVMFQTREKIYNAFNANGISFPFTQVTVHQA